MRLMDLLARCERARGFWALIWLSASGLGAGCGVYDPALIQNHYDQAHGAAGSGGKTGILVGQATQAEASVRCVPGQTSCSLPNARAVCVSSRCVVVSCTMPYADCDDSAANGCESDLTSAEHCGLCNSACRFSHAEGSCNAGRCGLGACDDSFKNCDGNANNGCEQKVDTPNDCGDCGQRCDKPAHATAGCNAGTCGIGSCDPGWGDCNDDAADGCEQKLDDPAHCGACQETCAELPHSKQTACENARCIVTQCADGFEDCNGDASDGCEANLAQARSCGGCGRTCDLPNTEAALCNLVQSKPECQVDHSACGDGDVEVAECEGRLTTGCVRGHADCDNNPANGCETDLSRLSSCGSCDRSCVDEHAEMACRDGRCVRIKCDAGYAECAGSGGCQSLLDDPKNCGSCGKACSGSTPRCFGGVCTGDNCDAQRADCDGQSGNGCEQALTSDDHCGGCDQRCQDAPHAVMSCDTGSCAIERCDAGFEDCDKDPRNGCEVDLNGLADCGGCGKVCAFAHSGARCTEGKCERTDCVASYADCNGDASDGCETNLLLPDNCGACGKDCRSLPNVSNSTCGADGCMLQCHSGRGDCDNDSSNGCETALDAATSCGSCDSDCTKLANVSSAACSENVCGQVKCADGYADCNGTAADGCERALDTASDCGACDKPCAIAHAQADCSDRTCKLGKCDDGFADCDGQTENGCEASLNDAAHCGACDTLCASGASCVNGACGCADDSQCATGTTCCEGRCVSTAGTCFPWPCIPGTTLPAANALNCGGCGSICLGWCCGSLL